jgi:hypothetical protein
MSRYRVDEMPTRKGTFYYVYDTEKQLEISRQRDRNAAEAQARRLNNPTTGPTPVATAGAPATGWSNAARARAGRPNRTDTASQYMADSLGLHTPAAPGTCHYCGQPSRTCDCY